MRIRRTSRKTDREQIPQEICAWPDCHESAEYRAPRSRDQLHTYDFYCLDHIRKFNKAWNYYKDMSEAEVERDIRGDVSWGRPTWRFGINGARGPRIYDPTGVMSDSLGDDPAAPQHNHTPEEVRALRVLDLTPPVTAEDVKNRYKMLAKSLHPDVTQGDKASEESFKRISEAYRVLRPWMNNVT